MFKHQKKSLRKQDQGGMAGAGSGILLEPMEPRILLSAEIGIPPQDLVSLPAEAPAADPDSLFELPQTVDTADGTGAGTALIDVAADAPADAANPGPDDTGADAGSDSQAAAETETETAPGDAAGEVPSPDGQTVAEDAADATAPAVPVVDADGIELIDLPLAVVDSLAPPAGLQLVFVDPAVPEFESLLAGMNLPQADTTDGDPAASEHTVPEYFSEAQPRTAAGYVDLAHADAVWPEAPAAETGQPAPRVQVFVLDAGRDGIEQISSVLAAYADAGYEGIGAVHVLSHGAAGYLRLGNASLTAANLGGYQNSLRQWDAALAPGADVLLYGCDVAAGEAGVDFIQRLAGITGADVAASSDATGGASAGGDWVLERATGVIETASLFTDARDYAWRLADIIGTDGNDTLTGNAGEDDNLSGLAGNDTYVFQDGWGSDTVIENADAGSDTLDFSRVTTDLVFTLAADGSITVSDGGNTISASNVENLIGGSGRNTFVIEEGAALAGSIDGGAGVAILDYSAWTGAVNVDLSTGSATAIGSVSNIDNLIGGSGNDVLIGDAGDNVLTGNAGDDTLAGGAGDDTYVFADGWGADTLTDNEGSNTPDFAGVSGILTLSNDAGNVAIGDGINSVTLNLGASDAIANAVLDIRDWQAALEDGMRQLTDWADALGDYSEMANALPSLDLTLDQVLDARNSIARLQQQVNDYFTSTDTPTSEGLLNQLADLNVADLRDNPDLGGLNASIAPGMTLDVVISASGNPELKFNFVYNAERTTTFDIDLGREAAELGVQLAADANFDLNAQLNLDAALGLEISDNAAGFFLDVNNFDVSGRIDATDLNFGVDIGFLEAAVEGGSIRLDAGLDLNFSDIDGNGANRLSLDELAAGNIGSLLSLNRQAGNGLNVSLPVNVYNDSAQSQLWDTFSGQTIGVTADDVFSGESPDVTLSNDIRDFNNLSAEEMLGMLDQLDEWLLQLAKSEVLDLPIPLTDGQTIGDALDFAQAFREDVLRQLAQYDEQGFIERDADGNPILNFDSVQTLSERLTGILSGYRDGIAVLADYDVATKDLSFRLEWSRDFEAGSTAVDFDIDLGSFGGIESASELGLTASASLGFTFGVNLAPNEELHIAPPLFSPELPDNGILSSDAAFTVSLYEESASGETLLRSFDIELPADDTNASIDDLVDDVQAVLDVALESAGHAAGDIVAEYTGNRIALTALPGSTTLDNGDGTSSAQTLNRRVQVVADPGNTAYTELGLMISPAPWDGRLSGDAAFSLIIDEAEFPVTVAADSGNGSIDDLVDDINAAIAAARDADGNPVPAGVEAYRAMNSNLIAFRVDADAGVARFGMKDINDIAASELGLDFSGVNGGSGNEPIARGRATEFFIEDARFSGNVSLDAGAIEGAANLGFLGVNINESGGSISANATLDLYDAENDTSRITLDRLLAKMADGDITDPASGIIDASISGGVDVDLTVAPETGIGMEDLQAATVALDLNIADWLANPPVLNDSSDPDAIQVSFDGPDIDEYLKFENIGFTDVIHGLNQAVDYLRDLEGEGGSGGLVTALDQDLPVINRSTSDLISMADQFASFVDELEADQAGSAQAMEILIKDYLGLDADSDLVELVLDTTAAGAAALRIDLNFTRGRDLDMPMELNLDKLASLADFDGFNDRFGNFIGVSSSGDLGLEVEGRFNLSLGLNLDGVDAATPPSAFLYGGSDGTGLDFAVRATGSDLEFTAQTGPFGINVIGGEVSLGSGIGVVLENPEYDFGGLDAGALNIDITNGGLAQAADISLPVYFPSVSSPVGGEGNNIMAITVDDIAGFFDGVAGSVSIDAPDFTDLEPLTLFGMLSNPAVLVDGLDALLFTVQQGLNSEVLDVRLPFLGDALQPAAQFIEGFREDTLAYLGNELRQSGAEDPDVLVQETLFNIFASEADGAEKLFGEYGGLGLLQDRDGDDIIDLDDIEVSGFGLTDTFGQFDFRIGQSYVWDQPVDFDLGLPALGLDLDAGVELGIDWSMDFGFGIDQTDGFYFVTAGDNEIQIDTWTILTDGDGGPASASGTLGFLQLDASDGFDPATDAEDDIGFSHLALNFDVELADPDGDGKLTFGEIVSPATEFGDIVSAGANGHATGDLDVKVDFGGLDDLLSAVDGLSGLGGLLPEIDFDLALDWSFLDADPSVEDDSFGASPEVAFNNIELDLGSFISDFAGPFLEQIGDVLEPLDWLIGPDGMLNKRLPVISDLAGYTVTLTSLAERLDTNARITPFLDSVQQIYNLIDMVESAVADANANGGSLVLEFGDLNLTDMAGGDLRGLSDLSGLTPPARPDIDLDSIGSNDGSGKAREFAKTVTRETTVGEGSVDFAILKPASIFGLLLGKEDVNLVTYDLPRLEFNFDYRQSFPVFGPLSANLRGAFNAGVDLALGYDTLGLSRFLATDNPAELINGFFVSDIDFNTGEDVVEAWLRGSIGAGASLNLRVAEAGTEGGIRTGVDFNLSDLDNDGKVRFPEMGANLRYNDSNPLAVFDISGAIDWFFRAFVEVDLLFFQFEDSMDLGSGTIYDFNVPFDRQPMPAQIVGNDLILNIGKNAGARLNGNASDGDEIISVAWQNNDPASDYYTVSYTEGGTTYTWDYLADGITRIVADGGAGNDRISIAENITIATEIDGGSGDDVIYGGGGDNLIRGGEGRDRIYGRGGNDELYGDEGGDIIEGGEGDDILYGGAGNDILRGFGGDDALHGEGGDDTLEGGLDNDTYYFANGFGKDTVEDAGSVLDRAAGDAGDTWDFSDVTTDITFDFGSAGYLDGDRVRVGNLDNSVTETGPRFAVETVFGGSGAGGTGSDTFNIYRTADYGDNPGLDVLLLDGRAGSDTYISYFKPAWIPIEVPMNVSIRDQGNLWDTDRAVSFGSSNDDLLEIDASSVDSVTGDMNLIDAGDAASLTPPRYEFIDVSRQSFAYGAYGDDSGLESLEVIAKQGDDRIFVQETPDYLAVSVSGSEGDDMITVGRDAQAAAGSLAGIDGNDVDGPLVIRGDEDDDSLFVDDSSDNTDNPDGVLSDEYISGMGMAVGIDYGTIESLGLIMGTGNDGFTVASSIGGATYLTGNAGADVINVQSASGILQARGGAGNDILTLHNNNSGSEVGLYGEGGNDVLNVQRMIEPVTVRGGDDDDTINAGSAAPDTGGVVNFIADLLDVDGEAGTDTLNVDDTGESEDDSLRVTRAMITGLGMRDGIRYASMEFINIGTGSGNDHVDVESTAAGSLTTIATFAGDASVNVSSDAPLNQGNLDGIQGELSLLMGNGRNELNISDKGSLLADDDILITENRITGLAPAPINYFTTGRYDRGVNIWFGEGSDTAAISSTHSDSVTTVWANEGDDRITAADADGSADDGLLVMLGEAGADTLDAGDWNTATILLGDEGEVSYQDENRARETLAEAVSVNVDEGGDDTLVGGSADDILIGGAGADRLTGNGGGDVLIGDNGRLRFINGLPVLMETFDSYPAEDARAPAEIPGGNDVLEGNAGDDRLFGGNGADRLFGGSGDDIITGDGGRVTLDGNRVLAETTGFFIGGDDFLDGGAGDDWLLGGAANDLFVGNLSDDILIGDYARITVENGKGLTVVRLGQEKLDFITSTLFSLYTPDILAFGPAAIGGIIPSGSAATAYEPVYNRTSVPVGSSASDIPPPPPPPPPEHEPQKTAEELAFEQALQQNPPAAGETADVKPAPAKAAPAEAKPATPPGKMAIMKEVDCFRIKGPRLGLGELWDKLLDSDSIDEAVGVASDMIDVLITGEPKKMPDRVECKPADTPADGEQHGALEMPAVALGSLLGIQAFTSVRREPGRARFDRAAFERLEREARARRYSSW